MNFSIVVKKSDTEKSRNDVRVIYDTSILLLKPPWFSRVNIEFLSRKILCVFGKDCVSETDSRTDFYISRKKY